MKRTLIYIGLAVLNISIFFVTNTVARENTRIKTLNCYQNGIHNTNLILYDQCMKINEVVTTINERE